MDEEKEVMEENCFLVEEFSSDLLYDELSWLSRYSHRPKFGSMRD
jgi:hypothetical protein